jgi:cell division protein FtsQ
VGEVAARSISSVTLTLLDGRVVNWGGVEHSDRKAAVTLPLLTQPGQTYDVSSPDLPTVR